MSGSYPNSRLACLFCTQKCHRTHGNGQEMGATMLSFVKIMTKCMIRCRGPVLSIPGRFRDSVSSYHHNMVILEGPSGEEWAVQVYEHTSRMYLRAGWGRFVKDNRLEMGDILFFTYIGDARFSLKIYGVDGMEKSFPFSAKNAQARATYPANKKRLEREWEAEDNASNASQVVERNIETAAETSTSVHESRRLTRQAAKSSTPPKSETFVDSAPAAKPNVESCKTVQLGSPENPIDLDDDTSETDMDSVKASCRPTVKRKLQFGRKHGNGNEASGVPFLRRNRQRQAPLVRSKCLLEELEIQAAFSLAMEAATSYVTDCPSFIISLRSFQVTGLDVLDVNRDFAKQFLPSKAANLVLVDMNGRSWPVKWFGIRRSVIAAGWAKFVQHHSLKSRDVCLFELTAPRNFQVRIYRLTEFRETLNEAEAKGKHDTKNEVEILAVEDEEGITSDKDGNVKDKQKSNPVAAVENDELVNKLMQFMHKPAADMLSVLYKLATNC